MSFHNVKLESSSTKYELVYGRTIQVHYLTLRRMCHFLHSLMVTKKGLLYKSSPSQTAFAVV